MKKIILTACCSFSAFILFAQSSTQTKISPSKSSPQVTVVGTAPASSAPKHTLSATKQTAQMQADKDSLTVPAGMIVPGKKK